MAKMNLGKWMVVYIALGSGLGAGVGVVYSLCESGKIDGKLVVVAVLTGILHAIVLPFFEHWRRKE